MKLASIPFDGLFIVYCDNTRVFDGFCVSDIPEEYKTADVIRIYPFNDSIIVEIKEGK